MLALARFCRNEAIAKPCRGCISAKCTCEKMDKSASFCAFLGNAPTWNRGFAIASNVKIVLTREGVEPDVEFGGARFQVPMGAERGELVGSRRGRGVLRRGGEKRDASPFQMTRRFFMLRCLEREVWHDTAQVVGEHGDGIGESAVLRGVDHALADQ